MANFVADKPCSDLNTNLKPQKPSVDFISGTWKKFGTREQPLIASHGGILAVMRAFFVIFWTILAIFWPRKSTDDSLSTF